MGQTDEQLNTVQSPCYLTGQAWYAGEKSCLQLYFSGGCDLQYT